MFSLRNFINIPSFEEQKSVQTPQFLQNLEFLNQVILGLLYGKTCEKQIETWDQNYMELEISKPKSETQKLKTLIFDLDETLVSTQIPQAKAQYNFELTVNSQKINFNLSLRPYVREMLNYLSNFYEIFIFTASTIDYAKKISEFLDPKQTIIKAIIDRRFCFQTKDGVLIKDLRIFKNRNINSMLLIDNSSLSFCFQPNNGVPILPWNGEENDNELSLLMVYLKSIYESTEDSLIANHQKLFSWSELVKLHALLSPQ